MELISSNHGGKKPFDFLLQQPESNFHLCPHQSSFQDVQVRMSLSYCLSIAAYWTCSPAYRLELGKVKLEKGGPLPKFGEWDVNDPASAEGFTVIFNKARDEKKTGGKPESPTKADAMAKHGVDPVKPQGTGGEARFILTSYCVFSLHTIYIHSITDTEFVFACRRTGFAACKAHMQNLDKIDPCKN
ncbi:hypothetical protein ACH5RR_027755 [Cinchona calisaya]|uniref:RIN4 pathogenic type III effector avirulence factor Avr cleavage site domain-containing protein n=1 Tax=Cinchona calisaya TaxID=153742 RepID=A0ABD2YNV3_9GENT